MSAADFWQSSPRAILTLYNRSRAAHAPGGRPAHGDKGAAKEAPQPMQRLSRIPR